MPLYPLGVSRSRDVSDLPETATAGSAEVRWIRCGQLACAFVDGPHNSVEPLHHAAALETIHWRRCVLPLRFGVAVRDEAEIQTLIEGRSGELLDRLARLENTSEMAVRVRLAQPQAVPAAAPGEASSPLAYLEKRRSYYDQADAAAERDRLAMQRCVDRLQGEYLDWRRLPNPASQPTGTVRLAFLVERTRVAAFRACLECAGGVDGADRLAVLGPWPPYSFV